MAATGNEAVKLSQLKTWESANGLIESEISGQMSNATGDEVVKISQLRDLLETAGIVKPDEGEILTLDEPLKLSQLKLVQMPLEIVSWADGTDEEIAAMVAAADAGRINLTDYWNEGDVRTVHLAAMSATGVGESHVAQDVQFVLSDPGHYMLASGKSCNFVVLQKDCLKETGYINAMNTNTGGWSGCARRTWCNSVYRNAIPATLRPIFKQFTTYAANGTGSTFATSTDYFALFSEKEIFGSTTYANDSAESQNYQITWFKTSSNRIKRVNGSEDYWWGRSLYTAGYFLFCGVASRGYADWNLATDSYGIAPFGCI